MFPHINVSADLTLIKTNHAHACTYSLASLYCICMGAKKAAARSINGIAGARRRGIKARIDVGSVTIIMHPHARLSLYVLIHSTINNTRSEKYLLTESASILFNMVNKTNRQHLDCCAFKYTLTACKSQCIFIIHSCHSC